jgi:hypothetical protein
VSEKQAKRCDHRLEIGGADTLALQWAGPALYLFKGERACPFYVIGNQTNHEDQTNANSGIVDAYVATNGGYVHKTSRHSVTVGGFRRGAPTGMIKLRLDMPDPVVASFFDAINEQVVDVQVRLDRLGRRQAGRGAERRPLSNGSDSTHSRADEAVRPYRATRHSREIVPTDSHWVSRGPPRRCREA